MCVFNYLQLSSLFLCISCAVSLLAGRERQQISLFLIRPGKAIQNTLTLLHSLSKDTNVDSACIWVMLVHAEDNNAAAAFMLFVVIAHSLPKLVGAAREVDVATSAEQTTVEPKLLGECLQRH